MTNLFTSKTILIPGGSGSWGNELTRQLLEFNPAKIIIYSRGEIAQVAMQRKFNNPKLQFVIGDVRDRNALSRLFASTEIDYVFHLAALKHVPICENEPWEAVATNIAGISNVIDAVLTAGTVKKFFLVSTDKAVDPVNVYGNTKAIAEKMVIKANCRTTRTEFLTIRGGNVLGTNGSIVPYLIEQIQTKNEVTITDRRMTRYFMPVQDAIRLLFFAAEHGIGGETYVMNMPSFYIVDLALLLIDEYGNNDTKMIVTGAREGEKMHETLISKSEVPRTKYINNDFHVIYPAMNVNRLHGQHYWDDYEVFNAVNEHSEFTSYQALKSSELLKQLLQNGGFIK